MFQLMNLLKTGESESLIYKVFHEGLKYLLGCVHTCILGLAGSVDIDHIPCKVRGIQILYGDMNMRE